VLQALSETQQEFHRLKWEQGQHEVGSQEYGRCHFTILDILDRKISLEEELDQLEQSSIKEIAEVLESKIVNQSPEPE